MFKKILVLLGIFLICCFLYLKFIKKKDEEKLIVNDDSSETFKSNLLENVEYISKDTKGNKYIIRATKGEIDLNNNNIIFLEDVRSLIELTNSEEIKITSNFGKYNTSNYDTIFSKKVIITYLDNKITGDYLDFSLKRNSMIISKNIVFTNLENVMRADVVEINIETKDTKIFMYENNKKVNIKNKNY